MIVGLCGPTSALSHVVASLVGIVAGLVLAGGIVAGIRPERWAAVFLVTTVLANVTGFGFPFVHFLPSYAVGIISLVVLAVLIVPHYGNHFAGSLRTAYTVGVVPAPYCTVFLLLSHLFHRRPSLSVP